MRFVPSMILSFGLAACPGLSGAQQRFPVPTHLPRTAHVTAPDPAAPVPAQAPDCRELCSPVNQIPGEAASACLTRVHRWLAGLERFYYESLYYKMGVYTAFCRRAHEGVMESAHVPVPEYRCQRLEYRSSLIVPQSTWNRECRSEPTQWWCDFEPLRPRGQEYAFVVPFYKGVDCPSLSTMPPLRR